MKPAVNVSAAIKALETGDLATAEKLLLQSMVAGPSGPALAALGRLRLHQKRLADAVPLLQNALKLQPSNVEAALDLAEVLRRQGKLQAAANLAQQVVRADDSQHRGWNILALLLEQSGAAAASADLEQAMQFASRAVQLAPDNAGYLRDAAALAGKVNNAELLLRYLTMLHEREPLTGTDRLAMLSALVFRARCEEASRWYHAHFALGDSEEADRLFAANLLRADRIRELEAFCGQLLETWPASAPRWYALLGKARHLLSGADAGVAALREGLEKAPANIELLAQLAMTDSGALSDAEQAQLETFLEQAGDSDQQLVCSVAFALADLAEKRQDYDRQLALLHRGNAIRKAHERYVPEEVDQRVAAIGQCVSDDWVARAHAAVADAPAAVVPVFVLCMPRSGTTLVEQILCSHSAVEGIGEAGVLYQAAMATAAALGLSGERQLYAADSATVAPVFRRQVQEQLDARQCTSPLVVEKSMTNAHLAGLARAAFPEARFVMTHRHPMDVAFGCYKQLFMADQAFSCDLDHCAHAYRVFMTLMDLWQGLADFPVLRLDYETLVADFEPTVRRLLDFLALPFEPACLEFQKNTRAVSTASVNQVRQGLFSSAVGRWQRYGDGLAPLRDAFARYGVAVDED